MESRRIVNPEVPRILTTGTFLSLRPNMFNTGKGPLKLDGRSRLQLPAGARDGAERIEDKAEFFLGVLPGVANPSVWMMTRTQYKAFCARLKNLGDTEEGRLARSAAIGSFTVTTTDEQGRLSLPEKVVEEAGINEYVWLVGLEDRLEVWASETL
jgi:DNA-binding transcriptional regulator/RsmH inhibitor MraZ